jgi:hypothetical protein
VKIWIGKLKLRGDRGKEGAEVAARIVLGASVMFEVADTETSDGGHDWRTGDIGEIHAGSLLRALGETGKEVP